MSDNQPRLSRYNDAETVELLRHTADLAVDFLASIQSRAVVGRDQPADVRVAFPRELREHGEDPRLVIAALARAAEPGLVASTGPRYFGFVTGGSLPAALAADWLTSAWDQNACLHVMSPAAAEVEALAAEWLLDLLGLPAGTSVGFTTGATMANFTALAAARHAVLARVGWDVAQHGLATAPQITVVVGAHVHASVLAALQLLGFGRAQLRHVAVDTEGRMRVDALQTTLAAIDGPLIVCAQAGNVCSGAFDPFAAIADAVAARRGWLHVDGAFGLWAAAVPALRPLVDGLVRADSWATDAHKWLNVPYDSGVVFVRDPAAHRAATTIGASYLVAAGATERDGSNWVPELSRRARGFAVYAALRALGRAGVRALVERSCAQAGQMAALLGAVAGVEILNEVVLNQVLVRFVPTRTATGVATTDADTFTRAVIRQVQDDGTCWLGGATWHGLEVMRISLSNWDTSADDVARSAAAILRCARTVDELWAESAARERKHA